MRVRIIPTIEDRLLELKDLNKMLEYEKVILYESLLEVSRIINQIEWTKNQIKKLKHKKAPAKSKKVSKSKKATKK